MRKLLLFTFPVALAIGVAAVVVFNSPIISKAQESESLAGYIDEWEQSKSSDLFTVKGWAYNPDDPDSDVMVEVWIDGVLATSFEPDGVRADITDFIGVQRETSFFRVIENEHFSCKWKEGVDSCRDYHDIAIIARDIASGGTFPLGGGEFQMDRAEVGPLGSAERVIYSAMSGELNVKGWVTGLVQNPDHLLVVVNGEDAFIKSTTVNREDVEEVYRMPGRTEGFDFHLELDPEMTYVGVQVYTIDRAKGTAVRVINTSATVQ